MTIAQVSQQADTFASELMQILASSAVFAGDLRRLYELVAWRFQFANFCIERAYSCKPIGDVPAAISPGQPAGGTDGEKDSPSVMVQLFSYLSAGLSCPDHQYGTRRQPAWLAVLHRVKL